MKYQVQFSIIHQPSCRAKIVSKEIETDIKGPSYADLVAEFFRHWDDEEKYSGDYVIGVIKMQLNDN